MSDKLFIVKTEDNKWFSTDEFYFSDDKSLAKKYEECVAMSIIDSIKTMKLIKEEAA